MLQCVQNIFSHFSDISVIRDYHFQKQGVISNILKEKSFEFVTGMSDVDQT